MRSFTKMALAAAVAGFASWASPAKAVLIDSTTNNPLNFSWNFASAAGALTGTGSMTVSGFSSTSLTVAITLNNTSGLSSNRLTSFGFGINPNATGVSFNDADDAGMVGATLDNIPSLATIEVCAFGGQNCSGGSNGGILGGASDAFSVILTGNWGTSVNVDPIGFKYQTGLGSFEFTTTGPGPGPIPEPMSLALLGMGVASLGLVARRRRRHA